MRILQFKLGGEYEYNVTFETLSEKRKIQTNDEPENNLMSAVASTVTAAVKYFRFENIRAIFRQITFNYPDNNPQGFVIEFLARVNGNIEIEHIVKSERLLLLEEELLSLESLEQQNRVNEKNALVIKLRGEIEAYALGARTQQELPFANGEGKESLFEGEE